MKKVLAAMLIAVSLALPAGVAAFTPQETAALKALCRVYPNTPPAGVNMDAEQWQSLCRYFLRLAR